jgi:hypothetical protein|tara:strand:- start:1800 stop:2132 length:333 start_codon:yes stop_codon:yes gene_type:complete
MSDDLKKMMSKLKEEKKKKAEVVDKDPESTDEEDETVTPETPTAEATEEQTPLEDVSDIDNEVAVLQNDGVFRREVLLAIKELTDVHKVNTQTLLDLKKLLEGSDDKKEK